MREPRLVWALCSRTQRVAAHQLLHHGDGIHQTAAASLTYRVHGVELCDDNGQRNGFAKGMIGSICEGSLSFSLSLSTTRQSVDRCVKAAASSVFYHRLLVGYARARQPAWLPRWCRRCLWNRSEKIINGLTVHSPLCVGRNSSTVKRRIDMGYNLHGAAMKKTGFSLLLAVYLRASYNTRLVIRGKFCVKQDGI